MAVDEVLLTRKMNRDIYETFFLSRLKKKTLVFKFYFNYFFFLIFFLNTLISENVLFELAVTWVFFFQKIGNFVFFLTFSGFYELEE